MAQRKTRTTAPATKAQIERGCTSKAIYYTLAQAKAVALNLRAINRVPVYPYACSYCDNYHIGHQPGEE